MSKDTFKTQQEIMHGFDERSSIARYSYAGKLAAELETLRRTNAELMAALRECVAVLVKDVERNGGTGGAFLAIEKASAAILNAKAKGGPAA